MALTDTFKVTAAPGTDIWRKPPTTDVFNGKDPPTALPPAGPTPLRTSGPLTSFRSARLSFNFTPEEQYDQGGILLSFRRNTDNNNNNDNNNNSNTPPPKWIKSGIEYYNSLPRLSTVACDAWADWSVAPHHHHQEGGKGRATGWTTMQVEKDKDGNGTGLWVYAVVEEGETGEKKIPLREICWVFGLDRLEEWTVEVHAMAARPGREKGVVEGLVVEFGGLEVKWAE
ncbi:hypothetical protein N658DRAFT_296115 [Parathielavia hyrcaniae]|uniref:Uncharacterized protein n=1 Tax=Parathielavia hyrcaniae TaxID=113614 RepID=A0AAN6PSP5_9PEZI|nr:hypothetical protein N658DRAFT_296115 [Parathielavia hyrcaniae]